MTKEILEWCAVTILDGQTSGAVILHGSTPTFRTFVMGKNGIFVCWVRLKLHENTPFVVEMLASWADIGQISMSNAAKFNMQR